MLQFALSRHQLPTRPRSDLAARDPIFAAKSRHTISTLEISRMSMNKLKPRACGYCGFRELPTITVARDDYETPDATAAADTCARARAYWRYSRVRWIRCVWTPRGVGCICRVQSLLNTFAYHYKANARVSPNPWRCFSMLIDGAADANAGNTRVFRDDWYTGFINSRYSRLRLDLNTRKKIDCGVKAPFRQIIDDTHAYILK